jgi:hypothetical protein
MLNLTADGGDIDLCLIGPSTEDGECEAEATAADGENASVTLETPEAGEWIAELSISGLLLPSADYELTIAYLAAGNETAEDNATASALSRAASTPLTEPTRGVRSPV